MPEACFDSSCTGTGVLAEIGQRLFHLGVDFLLRRGVSP
jgi:hypothetical protein